jgi:DNA-binding beta-propeller fold protein YncE
MTLALDGRTAWIACKEQGRVQHVDLSKRNVAGSTSLPGAIVAVGKGYGSIWALDTASTLYRLDPATGKVKRRIDVGASAAYNIWFGGGSVWVADDQGAAVIRISPATNRPVARIPVGDGPADMVFAGTRAWVIDHRDHTFFRIDTKTNAPAKLKPIGGEAAERLAFLDGRIWATGRGTALLEIDPETGATRRTIDIGGTGIDLVSAAGSLWIPVRTLAVGPSGFPTMAAVRRVSPAGAVKTAAKAQGRVDVHGLAAGNGAVWIADNTNGMLYRLAAR